METSLKPSSKSGKPSPKYARTPKTLWRSGHLGPWQTRKHDFKKDFSNYNRGLACKGPRFKVATKILSDRELQTSGRVLIYAAKPLRDEYLASLEAHRKGQDRTIPEAYAIFRQAD